DRRLEIDDAYRRLHAIQLAECVTPDVPSVDASGNRTGHSLGEVNVVAGIAHRRLAQLRRARVSENLVDTAPGHHVAGKEQCNGVGTHGTAADDEAVQRLKSCSRPF